MKVAGLSDQLPQNRYSLQKIGKGKIAIAGVVVCLLLYGILRFSNIVGTPQLTIENPPTATLITSLENIEVRGTIKPGDQLTINGESEYVGSDGKFKKGIRLYPGINTVEFKVKHFLGQEVQDIRKIIYSPEARESQPSAPGTSPPITSSSTASSTINHN